MKVQRPTTIQKIYQERYNPGTKSLNLLKCNAGDQSMHYLVQSEEYIRTLFLTCNQLTAKGLEILNQKKWQNLESLYLGNNNLGPIGAKTLTRGDWNQVQRVILNANHIGSAGAMHLAKGRWANVNHLELCGNHITDDGVVQLSRGHWPWVANLLLTRNKVTYQGVLKIARQWPNLKTLDREENQVPKHEVEKIKNAVRKDKGTIFLYMSP